MAANYFAPAFSVQINRTNLREDVSKYIVEVSITHEPDTMDHCSLTVANPYPAMPWIQTGAANPFQAGNEIAITIGYVDYLRPMFEGTITSISPTFPAGGMPTVQIEGYTRMYELQRGSRTRTFLGKTDREIAQEMADGMGLTLDTNLDEGDSTVATTYPYLIQYDKTDMAFLLERARRSGFEIQVEGKSLILRKPENKQAPIYTLVWGHPARPIDPASKVMPLQHFSPTLNTLRKVGAVTVRGGDLEGKKIEAQVGPDAGEAQAVGDGNGETVIIVDMPVASQEEAEQLAQSIYDDLAREYITGAGATIGLPDMRAGRMITLEGLGERFSGEYYVTQATHTISGAGYQTSFVVNRMGWSLLDLISPNGGQVGGGRASSRINGVVTAIVTNNQDDAGLGRVKVRFPWLDDQIESWWARLATPMAGKQRGAYFLPEVGDEVLVAFDHGDVRFPYILGGLWNSANQPPEKNTDGANNMRIIRSRSGHVIRLDDTAENGQPKGKIEIIDGSGQNKIVISTADNTIAISAQSDITIQAAGKLTLTGRQGVELTSLAQIKVATDGQTIIKGAEVHINDPD